MTHYRWFLVAFLLLLSAGGIARAQKSAPAMPDTPGEKRLYADNAQASHDMALWKSGKFVSDEAARQVIENDQGLLGVDAFILDAELGRVRAQAWNKAHPDHPLNPNNDIAAGLIAHHDQLAADVANLRKVSLRHQ